MQQQGSTLLITLILLVMLTFAGLAAINSSSLEEKVTGNFRDLQMAFHVGEAALRKVEQTIQNTEQDLASFNLTCQQGLCFSGSNPESIANCRAGAISPWQDESLWESAARTNEMTIDFNGLQLKAEYIVEFRCYLPREMGGLDPNVTNINDWSQFFRITVKAYGHSKSTIVMLQSTYKK